MTRPFILLLVFINIVAIGTAMWGSHLYHAHDHQKPPDNFEERLSERLSKITTPAQMQTASADLARIVASGNQAVLGSADLVDQLILNLGASGAVNIVVIALGVWQKRRQTQRNSSSEALQPSAGSSDD